MGSRMIKVGLATTLLAVATVLTAHTYGIASEEPQAETSSATVNAKRIRPRTTSGTVPIRGSSKQPRTSTDRTSVRPSLASSPTTGAGVSAAGGVSRWQAAFPRVWVVAPRETARLVLLIRVRLRLR